MRKKQEILNSIRKPIAFTEVRDKIKIELLLDIRELLLAFRAGQAIKDTMEEIRQQEIVPGKLTKL